MRKLLTFVIALAAMVGVSVSSFGGSMGLLGVGGAGAAAPAGLPLDGLTTGLKVAYSTRQLLTAYAGPALRVQNASTTGQMDIGFVANALDTTTLLTFCAGTGCYIVTWYDQSGGGNDATQAVASTQCPSIVLAGSLNTLNGKPAIIFGTTNFNSLGVTNTTLTANPVNTLFQNAVVSFNTGGANSIANGPAFGSLEFAVDPTAIVLTSAFTLAIGASTTAPPNMTGTLVESQYNSTTGAFSFWQDRTATGTGTNIVALTPGTLYIGGNTGNVEPPTGSIGEYIAYDLVGGIPSGTRTSIENNQHAYWSTP